MEMHTFSWSEKVTCMGSWRGKPWVPDIMKRNLSLDEIEIFVGFLKPQKSTGTRIQL
jgi:hypothetical protein